VKTNLADPQKSSHFMPQLAIRHISKRNNKYFMANCNLESSTCSINPRCPRCPRCPKCPSMMQTTAGKQKFFSYDK
jgi:hypothetical protein